MAVTRPARLRPWIAACAFMLLCLSTRAHAQCGNIISLSPAYDSNCRLVVSLNVYPYCNCVPADPPSVGVGVFRDAPSSQGGGLVGFGDDCCPYHTPFPFTFSLPPLPAGTQLFVEAWAGGGGFGFDQHCTNVPTVQIEYSSASMPPDVPTGVAATADHCADVVVSWSAASGANEYEVWRRVQGDASTTTMVGNVHVPATSFQDSGAAPGLSYEYWIVSRNQCASSGASATAAGRALGGTIQLTLQPPSQVVCAADNFCISAIATGDPPEEIRWTHGGQLVGIGLSYCDYGAGSADQGSYECTMRNHCGSVAASASVTVITPIIVPPPGDCAPWPWVCACRGTVVSLPVQVYNVLPTAAHWLRCDGTELPVNSVYSGINSLTLTISPVSAATAGCYVCVVDTVCGRFVAQQSVEVLSACSSVSPLVNGRDDGFGTTDGPEPASPRGALASATPQYFGINASQLINFDVLPGNGGANRRVFADSFGGLPNDVTGATLTIHLRGGGAGGASNPTDDTLRLGFADTSSNGGIPGFWTASLTSLLPSGSWGSGVDHTFVLDLSALPPGGNGPTNLLPGVNSHGFLDVIVEDKTGVDYQSLSFTRPPPCYYPWIAQQPTDVLVCGGGTATLSLTGNAAGAPFTYQWRRNGTPVIDAAGHISGALTATLVIQYASSQDAGEYSCDIANACGTASSDSAILTVNSADFNGDGDIGTDTDIEAFFACLAGSCCSTCGSADFNGDGDVGTDADIEAFFRVLAGGSC